MRAQVRRQSSCLRSRWSTPALSDPVELGLAAGGVVEEQVGAGAAAVDRGWLRRVTGAGAEQQCETEIAAHGIPEHTPLAFVPARTRIETAVGGV